MRLRLKKSLFKALKLAMSLVALPTTLFAGHMLDDLGFDLYRNLAENRGDFAPGATNVDVYDKSGNVVGTIAVVPDFGALIPSHGALAGGQSWVIDCVHAGDPGSFTFGTRLGAGGTSVLESYRTIQGVDAGEWNVLDLAVHRLSKVVTDVVHWEYTTDERYTTSKSAFENLQEVDIWRAGAGTHITYNDDGTVAEYHPYGQATAGTITPNSYQTETNTVDNGRGETIEVDSSRLLGKPLVSVDQQENIVPNNGNSGDSGSPVIFYNEETKSFQFIGVHTASTGSKDAYSTPYMDYSYEFFDHVIGSSEKLLDASASEWTVSGADASGLVQLKGNGGISTTVQALAAGKRGDTSTAGTLASNDEMWDSLDWVLANGNATLNFEGNINTGAGTMQFLRSEHSTSEKPATYFLNSTDERVNIQTAGYIIEEHVMVKSTLTGQQGDEWRIVGENARLNAADQYEIYGGFFELAGSGNNHVDLNLGIGVSVFLNREGGYAANNVQINTGSTVILATEDQIEGNIEFGASGGTLNLYGNSYARTSENLYVFDRDAAIINVKNATSSTFSYTKNSSDAQHEIKSAFYDSSSTSSGSTGILNLSFEAASGSDKNIHLSNTIQIAGTLSIQNADMCLTGYQLELANPDTHVTNSDYRPILDPDRWINVSMNAASISVNSSSTLTLGTQVSLSSKTLSVDKTSSIVAEAQSKYTGDMSVWGTAHLHLGSELSGSLTMKSGSTLVSEGGQHHIDLHIEKTSTAHLSGQTSITGRIINEGTMNLSDHLTLAQTIQNSGTLSFDVGIALDFSKLNGGTPSSEYQVFSSGSATNFTDLNSNNVIGQGTEEYLWRFQADGSVIRESVGRELWLDTGNDFDLTSTNFAEGDSMRFIRVESSLILQEKGLSVGRLYVDGVKMSLEANGHQLAVDRLLISSGGTMELIGDGLVDGTRIVQLNGATDTHVILNMDGGQFSDKTWLEYYTGDVTVRNGVFEQGSASFHFNNLQIDQDGVFAISDVDRITAAFQGDGTVRADGVTRVTFTQLADFTGHIDTAATSITFEGDSQAQLRLDAADTLYLADEANSMGAITGGGTIRVLENMTAQVSGLDQFAGKVDVDGHLKLGGEATLSSIDLVSGSTIELLDGAQIQAQSGNRWASRYNILLGEGAHLDESGTQMLLNGDDVRIGGSGTYTVKGLTLSRGNSAGTLHIDDDATLHIAGTSTEGALEGMASFQLSATNHNNTLNIAGTLISEAAIVNQDGRADVNVLDGGTLELRQGGTVHHSSGMGLAAIYVKEGGTLLLGNQKDSTDYSASLGVFLTGGASVGAAGTDDVTIYHTLRNPVDGAMVNFLTNAGQTLTIASALGNMHANVVGDGILQLSNLGSAKTVTLAAPELRLSQDNVQLDALNIQSQSRIASSAKSPQLMTAQLSVSSGEAALQLDSSIRQLQLGTADQQVSLGNKGEMRISALSSTDASLNHAGMSHAHVENASISNVRLMTLSRVQFTAVDIESSSFSILDGETLIRESSIDAHASFELSRGASLTFSNMHFDSWSKSMIGASKDFTGVLKDSVTLSNSSLTVAPTSSYSLTELAVFDIHGIDTVTSMATIDGVFYLDLIGMDLEMMMAGEDGFVFDLVGLDFGEDAELLNQIALRTNDYSLRLSSGLHMGGGAVAFNAIPEPSTASLALLALGGLLARRRRQRA